MSSMLATPKVFRNSQNTQLIYETPNRIYDVARYPVTSPNGSSITIYGHENGVRIIWKSGRPFKTATASDEQSKTNGAKADTVMIIDSDDEQSGSHQAPFEDKLDFEEQEEEEFDPAKPYPHIVQHLDVDFGAAALHIAVPPYVTSMVDTAPGISPAFLHDQLVFAVACSDHKIRVIMRVLTPPSPASKSRPDIRTTITAGNAGHHKWGETVFELPASLVPSDSISLTFTSAAPDRSLTRSGIQEQKSTDFNLLSKPLSVDCNLLVASHSRTGPGLLEIHRIHIIGRRKEGKTVYSLTAENSDAHQRIPLSSPATRISFHPNMSSLVQSTQLLVGDRSGACRIYDCGPSHSKSSNQSEGTSSNSIAMQQASWLLTLYPGFQTNKSDSTSILSSSSTGNAGRKSVLDVKWAMGGKAVIVLLADGEWGVWDIEGSGAGGAKGIFSRQSIKGGAMTAFSISGWIDSAPIKSSSSKGGATHSSTSKFAPMTPSTRKTAEPVLFSGRSGLSSTRGQITVTRLPNTSTTSLIEECITFWLEDSFFVIPSLRAYWEAQTRRAGGGSGNLLGSSSQMGRLVRLEGVNLRGERCYGIDSFPRENSSKALLPVEVFILAEHRYVILFDNTPVLRGLRPRGPSQTGYQALAASELDVTEIDQALSRMENGNSNVQSKGKGGYLS